MKIAVTGSDGLLGWHTSARLHAQNCMAKFLGQEAPFDIVYITRTIFEDDGALASALENIDAVLHFAGINRASTDEIVEAGNPKIADRLAYFCAALKTAPHIVYSNSTHAASDTPYGRSKKRAGEILASATDRFTDLVLPHIFGENARPYYNNVTATFIDKIIKGEKIIPNPDGKVSLLHAGAAADLAIQAAERGTFGQIAPKGRDLSVIELKDKLEGFHDSYQKNIYPEFSDPLELTLFNAYRAATYPNAWPKPLVLNTDARGTLFEAVKGGGGGQCFLSTTKPGITRGDHFHLHKVERFLVLQGEAMIRMRKVLGADVIEYKVSGDTPAVVDMPTLYSHSIENIGETELITLFWTHEIFDPENPDTFADKVVQ